jgi:hypothetical protein
MSVCLIFVYTFTRISTDWVTVCLYASSLDSVRDLI